MTLSEIAKQIMQCQKCNLCKTRISPVCGYGDPQARLMFIGEASL
jgi:uracil-DNA glycosylase